MIVEGNISNIERVQRSVYDIIKSHNPVVDFDSVSFTLSLKGNWIVKDSNGKKICLVSKFILPKEIASELGWYTISESVIADNTHILNRLKVLGINPIHCIISETGVIDAIKPIKITNRNITELGIQFSKSKDFDLSSCTKLKTLEGCPDEVEGNFSCANTQIVNLLGGPDYVEGNFDCSNCVKLVSSKYSPISISGDMMCGGSSLDPSYFKKVCKIGGEIDC